MTSLNAKKAKPPALAVQLSMVLRAGEALGAMTFTGIFVPKLNTRTYLANPRCRVETFFMTPELKAPCPDDKKFAIVTALAGELKKEGAAFNDVDGIRISKDGGWWLLRASNTQAVLVARAEAPDEKVLAGLKSDLKQRLARHGVAFAG